ncbi:MAG: hypothetical protein DRG83_07645 [Deltaproteobacteria bacterium]|nr:MAG: hypothetical protein DRG83_07645 [Deltaproteobacteria bacterium]
MFAKDLRNKEKMKILVLYFKFKNFKNRTTINEHLGSFRRYIDNVQFHYFNAANGVPWYLTHVKYDGVILHYTFLATRWRQDLYEEWSNTIKRLKEIGGYKVAIPQDEYAGTDVLCRLFRECGVKTVFTCFSNDDYDKVYPCNKVPLEHRITVFPGYIDEIAAEKIKSFCSGTTSRPIDLGYRARKLPYWLGRQGQLKYEIAKLFLERTANSELKVDISTDDKDVFLGDDWYRFLCRCRAVLGCEGGASLLDPTGEIRRKVEKYVQNKPEATFEEVERACFPDQDYNIRLFTLSPRHFECAITKTCQVLLEGNYGGILIPGEHYIEVKKDYSNIDTVIEQLHDADYCAKIAENAYRDIVQSGKYSYRSFANQVIAHISENTNKGKKQTSRDKKVFSLVGKYLFIRELLEPVLVKLFYVWLAVKLYRTKVFRKLLNKIK